MIYNSSNFLFDKSIIDEILFRTGEEQQPTEKLQYMIREFDLSTLMGLYFLTVVLDVGNFYRIEEGRG